MEDKSSDPIKFDLIAAYVSPSGGHKRIKQSSEVENMSCRTRAIILDI